MAERELSRWSWTECRRDWHMSSCRLSSTSVLERRWLPCTLESFRVNRSCRYSFSIYVVYCSIPFIAPCTRHEKRWMRCRTTGLRIGSQLGEAAEAPYREASEATLTSSTGWTGAVDVKEQFHPLVAERAHCQSSTGEPGERSIMELNVETPGNPVVRSVSLRNLDLSVRHSMRNLQVCEFMKPSVHFSYPTPYGRT